MTNAKSPVDFQCTECERLRTFVKPGLRGGKMVAYCPGCDASSLWEALPDDEQTYQ